MQKEENYVVAKDEWYLFHFALIHVWKTHVKNSIVNC